MGNPRGLVILGAGNFAREIHHVAAQARDGAFHTEAFVVDSRYVKVPEVEGVQVLDMGALQAFQGRCRFIIGIGDPTVRRRMIESLRQHVPKARFASVVHRNAVVMPGCRIDDGVYVAPGATIAIACHLQAHAVVNQNTSMGHDTVVAENAVLSPGCILSGWTRVGADVFLGSGVITYPGVQIGDGCVVSAGAVVSRNLPAGYKLILKPNTMALPPAGASPDHLPRGDRADEP